jgi:predicted dehydrogenase
MLLNFEVKICVIGVGRIGSLHARLLSRLGILDSIIDSNILVAEEVSNKLKVPHYFNLDSMLESRTPNGVIIAVPTEQHFEVANDVITSIPYLKALLIEKPVTSSIKEAEILKSNLSSLKIAVLVGHIEVYNPVVSRIIRAIKKGIFGDLRSILFQRRGAVGENRIKILGDVYQDVGVHDFDVVSRLLPKSEVKLFTSAVNVNGISNSSSTIITSTQNDFYCTFLMSREYAGKVRTIDIEGSKASMHANLITQILEFRSLEVARGESDFSAIRVPFSSGEQIKVYGEPLLQEIWNLIDCIKGEGTPLVSLDDAIKAMKIVEAARRSVITGESVTFTLQGIYK